MSFNNRFKKYVLGHPGTKPDAIIQAEQVAQKKDTEDKAAFKAWKLAQLPKTPATVEPEPIVDLLQAKPVAVVLPKPLVPIPEKENVVNPLPRNPMGGLG